MDQEEMSYKILRRIQQLETSSPTLTKIDACFYQNVSKYLAQLNTLAENEVSPQKHKLLADELQNTRKIAWNIYEQREKKIIQVALSTVRSGKPELKNLIEQEKRFYDSLIELIQRTREEIFQKPSNKAPPQDTIPRVDQTGNEKNPNPMVRVTQDIPAFVGTDMKTYQLRRNDVLSLSKEIAEPLTKRQVVQYLK